MRAALGCPVRVRVRPTGSEEVVGYCSDEDDCSSGDDDDDDGASFEGHVYGALDGATDDASLIRSTALAQQLPSLPAHASQSMAKQVADMQKQQHASTDDHSAIRRHQHQPRRCSDMGDVDARSGTARSRRRTRVQLTSDGSAKDAQNSPPQSALLFRALHAARHCDAVDLLQLVSLWPALSTTANVLIMAVALVGVSESRADDGVGG